MIRRCFLGVAIYLRDNLLRFSGGVPASGSVPAARVHVPFASRRGRTAHHLRRLGDSSEQPGPSDMCLTTILAPAGG